MRTLRFRDATAMLMAGLLYPAPSPAAPGPAGCGTGSWIAGTVDICAGELVYRDYVYDDYGAQGAGTGALDRLALEPDRHPGLPGRWPAERHGEQLRRHRGDPAARVGRAAARVVRAQLAVRRGQHRRGARDRHRQQRRDRRRHVVRPDRVPRHPRFPGFRSRAPAGTSCTCSRPGIPPPTRSRARSRCRPARTGASRRSRRSRARAP